MNDLREALGLHGANKSLYVGGITSTQPVEPTSDLFSNQTGPPHLPQTTMSSLPSLAEICHSAGLVTDRTDPVGYKLRNRLARLGLAGSDRMPAIQDVENWLFLSTPAPDVAPNTTMGKKRLDREKPCSYFDDSV